MKNVPEPFTTPPADIDAEACVLASVLKDPAMLAEVRPYLVPQNFYQGDYAEIYSTMLAIADAGKPVDVLLVRDHLVKRNIYQEVGGAETLGRLLGDTVFTAIHALHYAKVVLEKSKLRELMKLGTELQARCMAPNRFVEAAEVISQWAAVQVDRIAECGYADSIRRLEDVLHEVIESKQQKKVDRIATGLAELDALCGGLPLKRMTYVAGKAGMGKSQLCKQFALNIAGNQIPVGIITVEESAQKIAENYLAAASGVANNKIVYNTLAREDFEEVIGAVPRLSPLPIFIDDAQHRFSEIERTARKMVRKYGCRVLIVDHLHLIDGEWDGPREQEITRISGGLKKLFKELGVAGVVAAQMNRGGANDHEAAPELHHLRGSGSLEQDGDLIIQLHRQDYYEWKKRGNDFVADHRLRMFVNKNKDGGTGWRDAYFDGDSQTVTDWNDGRGPNEVPDPFAR